MDDVDGTRHRLAACRVRVMKYFDSPPARSDPMGGLVVLLFLSYV